MRLSTMSLNPLAPVTDYQTMLNRIFWATSASALVATWILRLHLPALDGLLRQIDFSIEFGGGKLLPVPGGYLVPALAAGILTRVFRFHARISDWLAVRECFDIDVILAEFAARLGIDLATVPEELLAERRHHLMRQAFYSYVSGPQPKIDPLLVQQALDAWSWFWIGIEAALVFILAALGLVAGGAYDAGLLTLGGTLALATMGLPAMRAQCRRYAVAQVRAILADPARAIAVRTAFLELAGHRFTSRRAA